MHKIGVLLSGCGVQDGSEIHEAVAVLRALDAAGAEIVCMAPDAPQTLTVNHADGTQASPRNMLEESARIARGRIRNVATVLPEELDALILPGGSGALKNLTNLPANPEGPKVRPDVRDLIRAMHSQKKPIGAICIAPVALALALREHAPLVTIGNATDMATLIESFGGVHEVREATDFCVDEKNRLVTTPAYMLASGPAEVFAGIDKLVKRLFDWLC